MHVQMVIVRYIDHGRFCESIARYMLGARMWHLFKEQQIASYVTSQLLSHEISHDACS